MRHPGLVAVREAFTTRAFGDHSLVFVSDFHPLSETLFEQHLSPHAALPPNPWSATPRHSPTPFNSRVPVRPGQVGSGGIGLPERVLWSYVVQLGSAIKAVHASGLAVRGLEANRVLVTGKNRVRIGGCGVLDVLAFDGSLAGGYQVCPCPPLPMIDFKLKPWPLGTLSRTTSSRSASSSSPSLAGPQHPCTTFPNRSTT